MFEVGQYDKAEKYYDRAIKLDTCWSPIIGIIPMLPALMVPFFFPSNAMVIVIAIAVVTSLVSLALLLLSSRLIPREKLLP